MLLHRKSFHPKSLTRSVVKTQLFRFARRSSRKADFDGACSLLFSNLRRQGYSRTFLRNLKGQVLSDVGVSDNSWITGFQHCNNSGCLACKYGRFGKSTNSSPPYLISHNIVCDTTHVVYVIYCKLCGLIYVGQTKLSLRKRILTHMANIRNGSDHPVAHHFTGSAHSLEDFYFQGIYKISPVRDDEKNVSRLLNLENRFISKFDTLSPKGLNILNFVPQPIPLVIPYCPEATRLAYTIRQSTLRETGLQTRVIIPEVQTSKKY